MTVDWVAVWAAKVGASTIAGVLVPQLTADEERKFVPVIVSVTALVLPAAACRSDSPVTAGAGLLVPEPDPPLPEPLPEPETEPLLAPEPANRELLRPQAARPKTHRFLFPRRSCLQARAAYRGERLRSALLEPEPQFNSLHDGTIRGVMKNNNSWLVLLMTVRLNKLPSTGRLPSTGT